MTERPPYSPPTMAEVEAVRGTNGYTVASTFSGCGGSCLGFEMAGFRVGYASEFIEEARNTYALNHPGVPVDARDIREVSADDLLDRCGVARGELDVLEGSPPCASFSLAGRREALWGEVKRYSDSEQRTDDLFFEFVRLVDGCRPRVFVAENVPGLIVGKAKGYFREIHRALAACGYRVEAKVLDAQWLGVPQRRRRLIFQGVRDDLVGEDGAPLTARWPDPLPYRYTVGDVVDGSVFLKEFGPVEDGNVTAVGGDDPVPTVMAHGMSGVARNQVAVVEKDGFGKEAGNQSAWLAHDGPVPTVKASGGLGASIGGVTAPPALWDSEGRAVDPETGQRIDLRGTAIYRSWCNRDDHWFVTLAHPDSPSPTVTAAAVGGRGAGGVALATEPRKFTLAELRRACGFPPDFALTGTYGQRWERLGRAVPPLMMRAVADQVRALLDDAGRSGP